MAEKKDTNNEDLETLRADIDTIKEEMANLIQALGDTGKDAASTAQQRVRQSAEDLRDGAHDLYARARLEGEERADAFQDAIVNRPFTSVLVAFGIGILSGAILGRSK